MSSHHLQVEEEGGRGGGTTGGGRNTWEWGAVEQGIFMGLNVLLKERQYCVEIEVISLDGQ